MKKHLQKSLGYYSNINNIIVILVDLPKEKECWHTLQDELLLKCVSGFGDIMPAWTRFFFFFWEEPLVGSSQRCECLYGNNRTCLCSNMVMLTLQSTKRITIE